LKRYCVKRIWPLRNRDKKVKLQFLLINPCNFVKAGTLP